ncbi:MAG: hypothetical protein ACRYG6_09570 [Janthinobacterium lividum]
MASPWTVMACTLLQADEPARVAQLGRMGARERASMEILMQRISARADVALRQFLAIRVKSGAVE